MIIRYSLVVLSPVGPGGDNVSEIRREGGPVEPGHHRVPVPHWQGALPGDYAARAQGLLREQYRPPAQVSN